MVGPLAAAKQFAVFMTTTFMTTAFMKAAFTAAVLASLTTWPPAAIGQTNEKAGAEGEKAAPRAKPVPIRPPSAEKPRAAAPKADSRSGDGVKPKTAAAGAAANALFEGYSKVLLGGVHIGFTVSRYELDPKKNEFVSTYFLKTNTLGGNVTESLKARATTGFKPVSYQYTSIVAGKTKTIDAAFKGDQMTAVVVEDGKTVTVRKTVPKGAFPSTFLGYMMLKGKEGLKPGVRYGYVAIAEEDAAVYPGEANVINAVHHGGIPALKIFVTFKGARFASFVTLKGDVLATNSPTQGLATELVAGVQEATAGQSFNPSALSALFGRVPEGKQNALALSLIHI